jgi:hypothetical protein
MQGNARENDSGFDFERGYIAKKEYGEGEDIPGGIAPCLGIFGPSYPFLGPLMANLASSLPHTDGLVFEGTD